jgi:hypothetical protein
LTVGVAFVEELAEELAEGLAEELAEGLVRAALIKLPLSIQ